MCIAMQVVFFLIKIISYTEKYIEHYIENAKKIFIQSLIFNYYVKDYSGLFQRGKLLSCNIRQSGQIR